MITCMFESGSPASLRHVVVHAIVERDGALLLVKRAPHLSEGGKWGLPGGSVDLRPVCRIEANSVGEHRLKTIIRLPFESGITAG